MLTDHAVSMLREGGVFSNAVLSPPLENTNTTTDDLAPQVNSTAGSRSCGVVRATINLCHLTPFGRRGRSHAFRPLGEPHFLWAAG